jgi:phosphocarrier protein
MDKMRQTFPFTYACGLHARPCTALVALIKPFAAKVMLYYNDEKANANSVIEMLSMGAQGGGELTFEAEGKDAEKVLEKIAEFIDTLNTKEHW